MNVVKSSVTTSPTSRKMTHPLTDKDIQSIWDKVGNDIVNAKDEDLGGEFIENALIRAAYDVGYAQALEDVYVRLPEDAQDIITCIQRKNSPSTPITLEELKEI